MTAPWVGCHFPLIGVEVSFLIILALFGHNPFPYTCIFPLPDDFFFLIAGECVTLLSSVCSVNSVEFKHVKMKSASADDHFQWRSVTDFLFFV